MYKFLSFIKNYFFGIISLIGFGSIVTIITLNLTFTYPLMIRAFDIEAATGFDTPILVYNYNRIISYINFPWIFTLYMPDFPMSETGEFHFWEVKVIFEYLQIITLVFLIGLLIASRRNWKIIKGFNASANLTFIIFGIFLIIMLFDFEFFFYWFHRAFFNNDYWLFNPAHDPIIRALPAELFMVKGFIMIGFLFLISAIIKAVYIIKKRNFTIEELD